MSTTELNIEERIEGALEQLRPFFVSDGGDMKLLEVTDKMIARIELHGACSSCSMSDMSLRAGEEAIKKVAPEILGVEAVRMV